MTEKEVMKFVIERSNDPIIKNPVLREAMNKDLGPRPMFGQGSSVDSAVRTIDPVQDSGNKIEEVLKAYELYIKNRSGKRPMKFKTFFEEYGKENFAKICKKNWMEQTKTT
jgi:sulfite reductase beta subunit-like hemoprotein